MSILLLALGDSFVPRSSAPAWLLAAILMFGGFPPEVACAQSLEQGAQPGSLMHFDLPAQALDVALQAFQHVSDLAVLAPAPLLAGRTSAAVNGDFSPREALDRVLQGTGFHAEFIGTNEALIVADTAQGPTPPVVTGSQPVELPIDGIGDDAERLDYAGALQARLTEALCAHPSTVPGGYRLAAQIRIDDKGTVVAANMVASSGIASRDAMIMRVLRGLKLDSPPPGLPEPVTILLRPAINGVHIHCPQSVGQD